MKEQIDEMAFDLCRIDRCKHLPQKECQNTTCAHCEAESLYNAGYRKQEWISVNDRLPENCKDCLLLLDNEQIVIGWYRWDVNYFVEGGMVLFNAVTHWMPLPEDPKMRKEDEGK